MTIDFERRTAKTTARTSASEPGSPPRNESSRDDLRIVHPRRAARREGEGHAENHVAMRAAPL